MEKQYGLVTMEVGERGRGREPGEAAAMRLERRWPGQAGPGSEEELLLFTGSVVSDSVA